MTIKITRLTLLFTFLSLFVFAQNRSYVQDPVDRREKAKLPQAEINFRMEIDTLFTPSFVQPCGDSLFTFRFSETWGFVSGMNGLMDLEKGMLFESDKEVDLSVTEVLVGLEATVVNDGNLRARIYALGSNGEPGALLGTSSDLKTSEINTDSEGIVFTSFTFDEPVQVNDNKFIATIDFTNLYAAQDTVFIFQTGDGCGDGATVWERWSDDSWNTGFGAWGFDYELLMLAVVQEGEPLVIPERDTLTPSGVLSACDTLPSLFGIQDRWGFITGTNEFGDTEKAQRIDYFGAGRIELTDLSVLFAPAGIINDGGISLKIYDVAGNGEPGELLQQSDPVKISGLPDFPAFANFNFSTPVVIPNNTFFASIDFSDLYNTNDTLGIVHTNIDCGDGSNTWERDAEGNWFPLNAQNRWGIDVDLYMIAQVNVGPLTSIDVLPAIGEALTLYPVFPNPVQEHFTLKYELADRQWLKLDVYHVNGQLMKTQLLGTRSKGLYQEDIDVSELANGLYFYTLTTRKGSLVKRFMIQR